MGQRLLIVDGDRRFIKDHQVALEAAFDVDFLYSTEGVLPLLESGDFAAVLICVEVAENKGYAICSAIRKNPKLTNLKVALISAKATEEEFARHRSLKGKADLYLHKPLISSALIASLTPVVPARSVDPDNPLGDLSGADLGDEWLESLKAELDTEDKPAPQPAPPIALPLQPHPPVVKEAPAKHAVANVSIALPAALQKLPPVSPDAGKVELLESRVRDLESKLQDLGEILSRKDQELQELHDKHASVTRNLDGLEQQRRDTDQLQEKWMEAENRLRSLEADTARSEEAAASLRRAMEETEADRRRLQGLVDDLGRQLSEKEREATAVLEAQRGLEDRLSEMPGLQGRIQELQTEDGQLREALEAAEARREEAGRVIADMERTAAELQSRVEAQADLERQLAEAREDLGRQEARVVEMQSQRDAKAQELIDKDREAEGLRVDVAGFEATLRGQRRELADQGGRLGTLSRECENLQNKLTQQDERTQELARALSEKMQVLAERDHEISVLQQAADAQERMLAEKTQLIEDRERDVAQLRNTKEQLDVHCEDLERELTRLGNQHEAQQLELMKGVEEREAQIGHLNATVETQREQIANLEREKLSLDGNLSERSARLEALTGAIADLENSIRRASDLTRPF